MLSSANCSAQCCTPDCAWVTPYQTTGKPRNTIHFTYTCCHMFLLRHQVSVQLFIIKRLVKVKTRMIVIQLKFLPYHSICQVYLCLYGSLADGWKFGEGGGGADPQVNGNQPHGYRPYTHRHTVARCPYLYFLVFVVVDKLFSKCSERL